MCVELEEGLKMNNLQNILYMNRYFYKYTVGNRWKKVLLKYGKPL